MDFFEQVKEKEFKAIGFKSKRRNLRELKQTGKTDIEVDRKIRALRPGKRISKEGNTYWESRKNRSDAKGLNV